MGYNNRSKDGRWRMPVGLLALILGLMLFGGVTAPVPAFAAAIRCGDCHSVPPSDTDNTCPKQTSKNHPAHTLNNTTSVANKVTCARCHPYTSSSVPTALHDNGYNNVTASSASPGMKYTSPACTNACHKNESAATWGGTLDCNACHYRSGASGGYTMTGLHNTDNRTWKHYSSPIKVHDNTKTITCLDCHPVNNTDNAAPRAHINTTSFAAKGNMASAFRNVTVTGIGYRKGTTQGTGSCTLSCHYNASDPFGNRTIYFKAGQTKYFGAYQTAAWNASDLKCNECHSTPGQSASFVSITSNAYGNATSTASKYANKRHQAHMFNYKLNPWNYSGQDRNIYCDDCHRTPDTNALRGFRNHSTLGQGGSGVISLPVKSQNARVYLGARNGGKGTNGQPMTFDPAKGSCTNIYCHTIMTSAKWMEQACNACHGTKDGVDIGSGAPGYRNWTTVATYRAFEDYTGGGGAHYTHVMKRGYPCRTCHYDGGGDGNPANHHNNSLTVAKVNVNVGVEPQWWFNNKTSTYSFATRSCSDVRCHYGASQNWDCTPLH